MWEFLIKDLGDTSTKCNVWNLSGCWLENKLKRFPTQGPWEEKLNNLFMLQLCQCNCGYCFNSFPLSPRQNRVLNCRNTLWSIYGWNHMKTGFAFKTSQGGVVVLVVAAAAAAARRRIYATRWAKCGCWSEQTGMWTFIMLLSLFCVCLKSFIMKSLGEKIPQKKRKQVWIR